MKKVMIALMMVAATSTASFAKVSNGQAPTTAKEVAQRVKDAPAGVFAMSFSSCGNHKSVPQVEQMEEDSMPVVRQQISSLV